MQRAEDGIFTSPRHRPPGAAYRYRIDGEPKCPTPPRTRNWKTSTARASSSIMIFPGKTRTGAAGPGRRASSTNCMPAPLAVSRRHRATAPPCRTRHHRHRADADRRFPRPAITGAMTACCPTRRIPLRHAAGIENADRHRAWPGLQVFLDVVYNHFGPDGNYLNVYAKSFFREDRPHALGQRDRFPPPPGARFLHRQRAVLAPANTVSTACASMPSTPSRMLIS